MVSYDKILDFVINKYRAVFLALYNIEGDEEGVIDDHLLYYLFSYNYIVLMQDKGRPEIWLGTSHNYNGVDRYGYVTAGLARVPDMRYNTDHVLFNDKNSIVIYSHRDKHSMKYRLWELMTEIASIMYQEQANLRLSSIKAVIQASTADASTLERIFNEIFATGKEYVLLKDKEFIGQNINKIDLEVPYIASAYQMSFMFYHNLILEELGVNFTPHEKAERLITDEVNSNNILTENASDAFIKRINRYFKRYAKVTETQTLTIVKNLKVEAEAKEKPDPEKEEKEEVIPNE